MLVQLNLIFIVMNRYSFKMENITIQNVNNIFKWKTYLYKCTFYYVFYTTDNTI